MKIHHILNDDDLRSFGLNLHNCVTVVMDLETTGLDEHAPTARIAMAAFTLAHADDKQSTWVLGLSHPDSPFHTRWRSVFGYVAGRISQLGIPLVNQNVRFDVRWVTAHTGYNLVPNIAADTGLSSHLLDENQSASLKPRAVNTFNIAAWNDGVDFRKLSREQARDPDFPNCRLLSERVPYFELATYAAHDTYWTWRLWRAHAAEMGLTPASQDALVGEGSHEATEALRLGQYYQSVGLSTVRTVTEIEQTGMLLDHDWCVNRLKELTVIADEARGDLSLMYYELTDELAEEVCLREGWELSYQSASHWFTHWSDVMVEANKIRVIALTPKGKASWGKEVLARLAQMDYPAATLLLTYKQSLKEASYIKSWLEFAGADGRIRPTYNYYRVVTGRLSSANPNAQQCPRATKDAFVASPGHLLVSADYGQIEMRVAAQLSGCVPMIEAYERGDDLHTAIAARVAGVDYAAVTKEQRQKAKAINFGFLFGMGAAKFVTYAQDTYGVSFTDDEAESVRDLFFSTWIGLSDWHREQERLAEQYGYVKSPLGRLRRLPNIYATDWYLRAEAGRQAINSPVQGMASDMMILAATKIRNNFPEIRPIALVHDAILCEVPEDQAVSSARAVKSTMEHIHPQLAQLGCDFKIPLVADTAIGKSWGSCEPI